MTRRLIALILIGLAIPQAAAASSEVAAPCEGVARAAARYEGFWHRHGAELFGVTPGTTSAPHAVLCADTGGNAGLTVRPPGGVQVLLSPQTTANLAARWPGNRELAKGTIVHEWGHVYQDRDVVTTLEDREGGAEVLKGVVSWRLWRQVYSSEAYAEWKASFIARYGRGFALREQFGRNWGADPAAIR